MMAYKYGGGPWAARSISDLPDPTTSRDAVAYSGIFPCERPCKLKLLGSV